MYSLSEWLKRISTSQADVSRMACITRQAMHKYTRGLRKLPLDVAERIASKTGAALAIKNGEVKFLPREKRRKLVRS